MGLDDIFGFSTSEYRAKIKDRDNYDDNQLAGNIYRKRQQRSASAFGIGAGIALAGFTGGVSLAGVALSSRNRSIAKQKLRMLEAEWKSRGHDLLDKRLRDTLVPMAIGAAAMGVTAGVAYGIETAGTAAINHAATTVQPVVYTETTLVPTPIPTVEYAMLPNGCVESYVASVPGYVPVTYVGYGMEQVTANVAGELAALHAASSVASHGASLGAKKVMDDRLMRENDIQKN